MPIGQSRTHQSHRAVVWQLCIETRLLECGVEAQEPGTSLVQRGIRVIERAAILRPQNKEPDHLGVEFLENLSDGEEVAQGLGHFFVINSNEPVVHPSVHKGLVSLRTIGPL